MDNKIAVWKKLYNAELRRDWLAVKDLLTQDFIYDCDDIHVVGPDKFIEY